MIDEREYIWVGYLVDNVLIELVLLFKVKLKQSSKYLPITFIPSTELQVNGILFQDFEIIRLQQRFYRLIFLKLPI